jgi:cytidylate kinase
MIVTIDGPAGSGKSTAARLLARRLNFDFLDTGAMYRAVALVCLRSGIGLDDPQRVTAAANATRIEALGTQASIDGVDVTSDIRTSDVSSAASRVAAIEGVRTALVALQRQAASGRDIVTEGRDQGTIVFPNALCKFYITAAPEVRAKRRQEELRAAGQEIDFDVILAEIRERDTRDRTRDAGPLRQADDAIRIDSSCLSPNEVIERLVAIVRERAPART